MIFMKKLLSFLLLAFIGLSVVFFQAVPSLQAEDTTGGIKNAFDKNLKAFNTGAGYVEPAENGIFNYIGQAVQLMLIAMGIIFFCLVLYGGFEWMQAMGNDEKVKKAQDILRNAVIGLVIVVAAYALSNFAMTALSFFVKSGSTTTTQ